MEKIIKFIRLWLFFAFRAASQAIFGSAAFAGGVILSAFGKEWVPSMMSGDGWQDVLCRGLIGGCAGWAVVFLCYLFTFAPAKAYRALRPLTLSVRDNINVAGFKQDDEMWGSNATLVIRNRSDAHVTNGKVFIMGASGAPPSHLPILAGSFDLPPNTQKPILFAYWFSRSPPNGDDQEIRLPNLGGGLFNLGSSGLGLDCEFDLKVEVLGVCENFVRSRVFVNRATRRLVASIQSVH